MRRNVYYGPLPRGEGRGEGGRQTNPAFVNLSAHGKRRETFNFYKERLGVEWQNIQSLRAQGWKQSGGWRRKQANRLLVALDSHRAGARRSGAWTETTAAFELKACHVIARPEGPG